MTELFGLIALGLFITTFIALRRDDKVWKVTGTILLSIIFIIWFLAGVGIGEDETYISHLEDGAIAVAANNIQRGDCVEAAVTFDDIDSCSLDSYENLLSIEKDLEYYYNNYNN